MSLFGAATSGVDPQTGSYLNKEQRIAMFRASQGRGGAGGGSGSQRDKKPRVDPQSAIVVVRKNFSNALRTVQEQTQEATSSVADQVAANRKSIENLYKLVNAQRDAELKQERAETRNARLQRENLLRKARESLVEGVSSALAGIATFGKGLAEKALGPAKSLLDKLLQALGLLGAAWAVDNLPGILDGIRNFLDSLPKTKQELINSLSKVRGTWSWLDNALKGVKSLIGKVARTAFNVARTIFTKAIDIGKRVFTSIKNFLGDVLNGILRRMRPLVNNLWNGIRNLFRKPADVETPKPSGTPDTPKPSGTPDAPTPKGQPQQPPGQTPDAPKPGATTDTPSPSQPGKAAQPQTKNVFQRFYDSQVENIKKIFMGDKVASEVTAITKAGPQSKAAEEATEQGVKNLGNNFTKIKNIFAPVTRLLPDGGKAVLGTMRRILGVVGKVPILGWAIDTGLNLVSGQGIGEALMRGFASNLAGSAGWIGGAKVGAAAGTLVAPGPGTVIGGLLGGVLGSMLLGAGGDQLGAAIYEKTTGKERTGNKVMGTETINNISEMVTGSKLPGYKPPTEAPPAPVQPITPVTPKAKPKQTPAQTVETNTEENITTPAPEAAAPAPAPAARPVEPMVGNTNLRKVHEHEAHLQEQGITLPPTDISDVPAGNEPSAAPMSDSGATQKPESTMSMPEPPSAPGALADNYVDPIQQQLDKMDGLTPQQTPSPVGVVKGMMDSALSVLGFKRPGSGSLQTRATAGTSTPTGMMASDGGKPKTTVINMPPKFQQVPGSKPQQQSQQPEATQGQSIPTFSTRDPESDGYRAVSAKYYKLAF